MSASIPVQDEINTQSQFQGMFLAGAVGDALGAPVEFKGYSNIIDTFGHPGITDMTSSYGKMAAITDDTQMLLWTAEGLLRWSNSQEDKEEIKKYVHKSLLRWFATQRGYTKEDIDTSGWMWTLSDLHAGRAPGTTCLGGMSTSLAQDRMGTFENPVCSGAGCGGIMRIAPVGAIGLDPIASFRLGCDLAVLTHGEPGAYLAAGFQAGLISSLFEGEDLLAACETMLEEMQKWEGSERICQLTRSAITYSEQDPGQVELLHKLGGAWRGDEALALSVYAALSHPQDLEKAIIFSVNHSGDSDSTGSIVGNILGLMHGVEAIPERWLTDLELKNEIESVADDFYNHFILKETQEDLDRYPAN